MTKKIKLFTDSAADVPVEYKEKYGIEIVPITVMFGTVEYKDQVTLSLEEFWEKMLSSQELPSTNQANPHDFVEAFQPFLEQGYTILYIGLSSRLSGTPTERCNCPGALAEPRHPHFRLQIRVNWRNASAARGSGNA